MALTFAVRASKERVNVGRALLVGAGQGLLWGVVARAWMRLISQDPEFTWSGTGFILGAATIFGLATSLAATARRNEWRPGFRRLANGIGGLSVILLGGGAGSITLPTVIVGGIALARPTIGWIERVGVALVLLLGAAIAGGEDIRWAIGIGAVGLLVLTGYRSRLVLTLVASAPVIFVLQAVLFEAGRLPEWQRLAGAALYVPMLAPLVIWFSRTVAPVAPSAEG